MFKYNVKIQKVSGRLNESVLPSKSLVVKSKTKKTDKEVFAEASKFFKKKYGLVIESADVSSVGSNPIVEPIVNFIKKCDNFRLKEITRSSMSKQRLVSAITNYVDRLYTQAARAIEENALEEWEEAKMEGAGMKYMTNDWALSAPGEIAAHYVDFDWIMVINRLCGDARIDFDESYIESMSLGEAFITLLLTTDADNRWANKMAKLIVMKHQEMFR